MEQEVLKSFISGNPLDWLYPYIKKFSFLNQVKDLQQLPKFIIVGYIKEVQRAKKKWFFIKIEDISGEWEFFSRDSLDFKKFDLIILYGSKPNGRVYIDKIVKTEYEILQKLAGGKYDPERTVARAKRERYWDQKSQEIQKIKAEQLTADILTSQQIAADPDLALDQDQQHFEWEVNVLDLDQREDEIAEGGEDFESNGGEFEEDEAFDEQDSFDEEDQENEADEADEADEENEDLHISRQEALDIVQEETFSWTLQGAKEKSLSVENDSQQAGTFSLVSLPESMEKIHLLMDVLQNYPGDISIQILGKEKKISEDWLQKLRSSFGGV